MEVFNDLQEDIQQQIDNEMKNLNASIMFILPNQENLSQSSSISKTFTTPIFADQPTSFSFNGKINNPALVSGNVNTIVKYNNYNTLKYMLLFFLLVLAALTAYLLMKIRKSK